MNSRRDFLTSVLATGAAAWVAPRCLAARTVDVDICIYGGTSGGVMAAVQAARMGKTAAIVEPNGHLGGMSSGGLGWTDFGNKSAIGGLAHDFYVRVGKRYGREVEYTLEPRVAEEVFNDYAREAKATVLLHQPVVSVDKSGGRIVRIVTVDGTAVRAKVFIDATYEGDLLAMAGISHTLGRESNATYKETINGIQKPASSPRAGHFIVRVDPYLKPGDPNSGVIPLVDPAPLGNVGDADRRIQSYNYRVCFTDRPANRIPLAPPDDYSEAQYELLARWIEARIAAPEVYEKRTITAESMSLRDFLKYDPLPNGKYDFNNRWPLSTDFIGGADEYPEAGWDKRREICKRHEDYLRGFFHFLSTSPRVPEGVRKETSKFGLCKDEFTETGGWPHQIYVREARRMIGAFVMTQHHCQGREPVTDGVGLGAYGIDIHAVRRVIADGGVQNEGSNGGAVPKPYPISYGSLVPKESDCLNLFAPFCLSASHVAFGSIRMEPVFMALSQSAATAACMAIDQNIAVQRVSYAPLQKRLLEDGQVLVAPEVKKKQKGKTP